MDASVGTGPTGGEPDGWPYAMAPASAELPATQRVPSTVVGNTLPLPVLSVPEGDRVQQTSGKFISPSPGNTPQMVQTLAALYQSSRRSRNNTPVTGVKPKAPIVLPPPPPLYQKNGSDDDNRQTMITSTAGKGSNDSSIMTGSIGSPAFGLDYSTRSMMSTANAIMTLSMQTQRPEPPLTTHVAAQPSLSEDCIIENTREDEYGHINRDAALTVPSLSSGSAATDLSEIPTGNKLEGANGASLKRSPPLELNTEMNSEPPRKKPSILCGDMTATPSMSIKSGVSFDVIAYRSSRLSALTTDSGFQIPEDLRDENHEGTSQDIEFQMPLKGEDTLDETEREREERIIRRKIQRLLLIKHCSTCRHQGTPVNEIHIPQSSAPDICKPCDETEPDYTSSMLDVCPVTSRCAEGKALCAHIRTCKLPDCKYKWCITSREVLGHYMSCKDPTCRICEPVRHKGRRRKIDPPENVDIMRRSSSLETNDLWIENEQTGDFSVGQLQLTRI